MKVSTKHLTEAIIYDEEEIALLIKKVGVIHLLTNVLLIQNIVQTIIQGVARVSFSF